MLPSSAFCPLCQGDSLRFNRIHAAPQYLIACQALTAHQTQAILQQFHVVMPVYQVANWQTGCKFLYGNSTEGLVDGFGNAMTAFDNVATWGITIDTCYKYCGVDKLQQVRYLISAILL